MVKGYDERWLDKRMEDRNRPEEDDRGSKNQKGCLRLNCYPSPHSVRSRGCACSTPDWAYSPGPTAVPPDCHTGLRSWITTAVAGDGGSHTVTVTYPNSGPTRTLDFNYSTGPNSAIYSYWLDSG